MIDLQQLYDEIWYIKQKPAQTLISILEMMANRPSEQCGPAILAASMVQEWLCGHSIPTSHYERIVKDLRMAPLVWVIFFELYKRILGTEDIVAILQPTTISPKYNDLYSKVFKDKPYYGSAQISENVCDMLHQWGVVSVINFGSGSRIHKNNLGLSITDYEPTRDKELPDGPFDALVSSDVLEHIQRDELPAICLWFRLWSKRLILGVSTRRAGLILENSENAHCTVEPAEWWKRFLSMHLPEYGIQIMHDSFSDKDDYAVLVCVRPLVC